MNLPQLPADKANHYLYGSLAAAVAVPIGGYFGVPANASALCGAVIAGALKELSDLVSNLIAIKQGKTPPNVFDAWDFVATAAGGLPVAGVTYGG